MGNKIENGFAFVEKIGDEKDSKCVWISVNALEGSSIPEPVPDLVTTTLDDTDTYYGPDATAYDYCDHLPVGENITILWKEGDYYYVEATFMIYHAGSEETGDGYEVGTKRMYIHKDYVGTFTGEELDKTNPQCTTVIIDSNVNVVSGPAVVYEPIEYLDADTVVWRLGVGEENNCVFIEYTTNSGLKRRGWVPVTSVREATSEETSIDDLIVATGTVRSVDADNNPVSVKFMWGPEGVRKTIYKEGNTIAGSTSVDILWQEGDFYYVRYKVTVGGIDKYRCIYLKTGDVNIINTSNTSVILDREMDTSPNSYRYAKQDIDLYYYPVDGAEKAGSLSRLETMRELGVTIGDYTLVEYDTGFTSFDEIYEDLTENSTAVEDEENTEWIKAGVYAVRKRAWINKNNISEMPKPDGEVCLNTEGNIVRSDQEKSTEYIFKYLKALGFSDNAICAILGNVMQECTMNPALLENNNEDKKGYGIMQWTHYSKYLNRAVGDGMIALPKMRKIDEYANKPNETLTDGTVIDYKKNLMQSQLECMLWGCTNTGDQWYNPSKVKYINHTGKDMTFAEFMTSSENVKVLAMVFHDYFLRSGDYDENHKKGETVYPTQIKVSSRADYAQEWYDYLHEEGLIVEE